MAAAQVIDGKANDAFGHFIFDRASGKQMKAARIGIWLGLIIVVVIYLAYRTKTISLPKKRDISGEQIKAEHEQIQLIKIQPKIHNSNSAPIIKTERGAEYLKNCKLFTGAKR